MTSVNSTIISNIYKSRVHILEQLKERGYDVSNYNEFSINEVNIMYENKQLDMLLSSDKKNKVYIKYNIYKNITPNIIYNTINDLFDIENILDKETDEVIFILKQEPNDKLQNIVDQIYYNEKIFITLIDIKRLQFNILNHILVPKHEILSDEEVREIKETYSITNIDTQLPTISRFDPVSLAVGLRPRQVCKITRNSKTAIQESYYRICK